MKILATNGKETCIVEMSKDEVAQLAGFHGEYYARDRIRMESGQQIPIGEMYKKAVDTISQYGEMKKEFSSTHARIGKLLSLINKVEETP